ncbi:30S ribosomal protein S10 [Candidatus Kaiserbacteria bacterium CG10_big_fil_rev_8_21_14_0_10_43_70]|uniref:Small ribosomal subunit protein uS10 n=1 Tax=Candidatus Kaiserbacteria bacterium CG10_big_fil_rev_8_21_14_0_10_43_70 TaxID=1974605 RepID=A0A2H0ULJ0_9BACT|nr:MAG: 30S ribosomal protein S10 [Candidatus Kaiserbacteria bacterium CG10_big_fil_rev_8_21_14_0_10_43_70]
MTAKKVVKKVAKSIAKKTAKTSKKTPKNKAKKTVAPSKVADRLRISVRAYEHRVLDSAVKQIIDTAARHNAEVVGPVPLPTDIRKYTVNRSTFVHKDAREQFEMRVHKRLIDILNPAQKVIESLTNIDLPSGVKIDVKMM